MSRKVRDFRRGIKIFFLTMAYPLLVLFLLKEFFKLSINIDTFFILLFIFLVLILSIQGFIVNYTPVSVKNDQVSIPASDQIRTFLDIILINPITGLYRRRYYSVNDIENVANGYTKILKNNEREWNVVISGMKNGASFSQRIDCSNKQVRDEVRNVLSHTIRGRVNSDFAV